jgi:hypothetical protein
VEVFGVRVNRFADMWVGGNQDISTKSEINPESKPLCASIQDALNYGMRIDEILNAQP